MNMSLAKKLILGGIAMVALPLMLVGWYAYSTSVQATTAMAEAGAQSTAARLADMVNLVVQEEAKLSKELASSEVTVVAAAMVDKSGVKAAGAQIDALNKKLGRTMKAIGQDYELIFLAARDGSVIGDSQGGKLKKVNVSDRAYFIKAVKGQVALGQVVRSKADGKLITIFATPVLSPDGQVIGVLGTCLKLGFLDKRISGTKIGETGYAWMVNRDGYFISHPNPKVLLNSTITRLAGMEEVTSSMLAGQAGVETYVYKGVEKACGFAPVPLTGWSLAATQNTDEFMASSREIRNGVLVIGGLALLVALVLVMLFARGISKPINQVVEGLLEASMQVVAASTQVNSSSQSLAEGSSEQAACLEETSSSLEELSSMTHKNAENADQADALSSQTRQVVDQANGSMAELTSSMDDISTASAKISKIIKAIDEIAFQTNLLALNAAVEAARAGEAGAGFAVVADEVRNLALRAAEAAGSTAELIDGTVQKIKAGAELVADTSQAFIQVSESSGKVAELVSEIAAASGEQSQGIDQITLAMSEMDKVTQTSAANAEETASASEELNGQASGMRRFVSDLAKVVGGSSTEVSQPAGTVRELAADTKPLQPKSLPAPAARRLSPEKQLPLEDDFADF